MPKLEYKVIDVVKYASADKLEDELNQQADMGGWQFLAVSQLATHSKVIVMGRIRPEVPSVFRVGE